MARRGPRCTCSSTAGPGAACSLAPADRRLSQVGGEEAAAARREVGRQHQREAEKKQTDQAVGDLGQLKDKCRDGL